MIKITNIVALLLLAVLPRAEAGRHGARPVRLSRKLIASAHAAGSFVVRTTSQSSPGSLGTDACSLD